MIRIANAQLWVHDQDEALAFYTQKLAMELRADVTVAEMGDFRWLTVAPPAQPDFSIVLMAIPGPPLMDDATTQQVRELMAKRPIDFFQAELRQPWIEGDQGAPGKRHPRRVPQTRVPANDDATCECRSADWLQKFSRLRVEFLH